MSTIRCFLAVKLDIEVARSLAARQKELRARCDEIGIKVGWVPPPNLHVTVRFLGQIALPMAQALKDMLEPVTMEIAPFDIESAGIGAFPSLDRPRVIWAGISRGQDELEKLYRSVSARLVGAGFQFEDSPFKSHITLGRVKGGRTQELSSCFAVGRAEGSAEGEAEGELDVFGTTHVRNLYCYRSDLSSHGAEYRSLWQLPLTKELRSEEKTEKPEQAVIENGERQSPNEITESPEGCTPPVKLNGENPHDSNAG